MLYIAAAGNASMNLDAMIPDVPSFLQKYIPSFLPSNLMFVAATDNQDNLASFTNYGARTVSVGCAPWSIQYLARSASTRNVIGCVLGL